MKKQLLVSCVMKSLALGIALCGICGCHSIEESPDITVNSFAGEQDFISGNKTQYEEFSERIFVCGVKRPMKFETINTTLYYRFKLEKTKPVARFYLSGVLVESLNGKPYHIYILNTVTGKFISMPDGTIKVEQTGGIEKEKVLNRKDFSFDTFPNAATFGKVSDVTTSEDKIFFHVFIQCSTAYASWGEKGHHVGSCSAVAMICMKNPFYNAQNSK